MIGRFKEPAIVFGGGMNGLGVTRNLGTAGVKVYCVTERVDSAAFSNRCYKRIVIPNYGGRARFVRSFLEDFSRKTTSRPVIFATDDIGTLMLSELADTIRDDYNFVVPKKDVARTLVIKQRFYDSLAKTSVPFPRVYTPNSSGGLESLKEEARYPLFIRPSISPQFTKVFKRKGFIASNDKELAYYYNLASRHKIDVMFQEIIFGSDANQYGISGLFGKKGGPLAFFAYHRLRSWPPMFGNSSLMESYPLTELSEMQSVLKEYLIDIGYSGIMDAEFKRDIRDNQFKLLEVNARSWWQNLFPTKCGLNIILKAYLDAIGEDVTYSEDYVEGLKWIDLPNDLLSAVFEKKLLTREWFGSIGNIKAFSYFDFHDPGPFATNLLFQLRGLASLIR